MRKIIRKLISITAIGFLLVIGVPSISMLVNAEDNTATVTQAEELKIKQIEAGENSSFLIENDGSLWAWGSNEFGQLGIGSTTSPYELLPTKVMENVSSVSAAWNHTVAIRMDGSLWAWGSNEFGQLGIGYTTSPYESLPTKVMENVYSVSAGGNHTVAIRMDGSLWAWGNNSSGQLGDGTTISKRTPVKIMDDVVKVTAGGSHTNTIKKDGSLWSWGFNGSGQLGNGTTTRQLVPIKVLENVRNVSAGNNHTLAIKEDGSLWSWGYNASGQLGNGTIVNELLPNKVMENIINVSAGAFHTLAIKTDGSLWTWGSNLYTGTTTDQLTPVNMMEIVENVSAGTNHTLALKTDGSLFTWGRNKYGQLGDGSIIDRKTPNKLNFQLSIDQELAVPLLDKTSIFYDGAYVLDIKSDNSLWAWGDNSNGQLGDGTTINQLNETKIMENVEVASAGYGHSLAIKTDKSLWAWGTGLLGDGSDGIKLDPVRIMENVASVSAGHAYSLAIKLDGSLWSWGWNSFGQLGDGTTNNRTNPSKIMENVKSVSAGAKRSFAIKTDGSLWAWGDNSWGQLGNNTLINSLIPLKIMDEVVSVSSGNEYIMVLKSDGTLWGWGYDQSVGYITSPIKIMDNVSKIASGKNTRYAIKTDGSLWSWGYNGYGQVGDGTRTYRELPVKIMDQVYNISSGDIFAFAVKKDGSLWSWGTSYAGQLGGGNTIPKYYPTKIREAQLFYDLSLANMYFVPIFLDAPKIILTFSVDVNAKFYIASQDIPGNFEIRGDNQVIASKNGNAVINITNSSGSVVYRSVNFQSYSNKPSAFSLAPINQTTNDSFSLFIDNSINTTLNGQSFIGGFISEEGIYSIEFQDIAGFNYFSTFSIDKTPPIITIDSYSLEPTNQNMIINASTNEGVLNTTSVTFTSNGNFDFIAIDEAGNVTTQTVTITNIDKDPPVINGVSISGNYNTARTITFIEGTVILDGVEIQTGTIVVIEGAHEIMATDNLGNTITFSFTLDFIAPTITIGNYDQSITKQNVIVTASVSGGVLNSTSHTFTENGSFDFVATDEAGNVTTQTVTITNIDKVAPVIIIEDYVKTPINQDIIVTAFVNEGTLNASSHTFTENGSFDFVATDEAGNVSTQTVTITNIDKVAPAITIEDYVKTPINQNIIVTATTNEGTLNSTSHTFTENGSFDFVATDEAGNNTTQTVTITNIDKVAPVITIGDYLKTPTNQDVIVLVTTNEGTLNASSHSFSENGSFEFIATDEAGNVTTQTITINNIDKVAPVITIGDYLELPTNQDIIVIATTDEGTLNASSHTFIENGSFEFIATDEAGNVTTQTVTITNIDKVAPVITIGDYLELPTSKDVVVSVTTNEGTLNASSHSFSENGSFEFIATDEAGNVTTQTVIITNIDKVAPVITIGEYLGLPTNKDVIVTATTSEGTLNSTNHTFIENGSFEFIATDEAGNVTTQTVTITNIDKVSPAITGVLEGKTYIGMLSPTFDEGVGLLNDSPFASGSSVSSYGQHTLIVTDEAGNTTTVHFTIVPNATNIAVTSQSYTSLHVSWKGIGGVAGYEVYRGFNATGSFAKVAITDALDFIQTGLTINRSYFYKVRSYVVVEGITYYSDFSPVVSGKPIPAAPTTIDVMAVNSSSMQITWAAVEGATGYQLFRSFGPTGTFTLAASTTTNSYLNAGLTLNRTYFYRVRAYTMVGTTRVVGPYSTIDSAKPIPAAATNILAASGGYDRINLSWTPAIGAGGYTVYRSTSLTGTYSIVGNVTTSNYINTGLGFNTTYYYKVRSYYLVNGVKNYGMMSEPVSAKTVLSTPTVTSSNLSTTSIKLSWGAISGASGYEVYRSTTSTGTYALQGTVTTNTYSKTSLVRGTVYYYKVRAYRLVGTTKVYGEYSTPKYLKIGY